MTQRVVPHVVVSYADQDAGYLARLGPYLEARGVRVWSEPSRIATADAVLVLESPMAQRSARVNEDLTQARRSGRPVLVLLLGGQPRPALAGPAVERVGGGLPTDALIARVHELAGLRHRSSATVVLPTVAGRRRAVPRPSPGRRALSWPLVAALLAGLAALGGGTAVAVHALSADGEAPPAGSGTSQPATDPATPAPSDIQTSTTVPAHQPTAPGRTGDPAQPPDGAGPPPTDGVWYGGPIGLSIDGRDIDGDGTLDVWFISGQLHANTQAGVSLDYDAGWTPATFRDECEARGPGDMSQQLSGIGAGALVCARTSDSAGAAIYVARKEGNTLWINVGTW